MVFIEFVNRPSLDRGPSPLKSFHSHCPQVNGNLKRRGQLFLREARQNPSTSGNQLLPKLPVQQRFLQKISFGWRRRDAFGLQRQSKGEGCAAAGLAFGVNLPAMMMDDEKTGHQIDAIFGWHTVAHHEGVENDAQGVLRQARSLSAI